MNETDGNEAHDGATCPLERIRARVEGTLAPDELYALEQRLAADPDLRAFAAQYAEVHAWTAERGEPATSSTSFKALERRLERAPSPWAHVAALAAVVLAVGAGAVAWHLFAPRASRGALHLSTVDLRATPAALAPPPIAGLGDYDPRDLDGDVAWLREPERAMWLAGLSERPLLVYGAFRGCPLAAILDRDVFTQADVVSLFERYVPLRLDLEDLPAEEARALMARGYPFLEVWTPSCEPIYPLTRAPVPSDFVESMHEGLEAAAATGDVPAWDDVRGLLALFDEARAAEAAGDMARAEAAYVRLSGGPGEFALVGGEGLERLAADVRAELLAVRSLAASDVDGARARLERLLARYRGTRFAPDLAAVRERFVEDGRFPEVAPAS